MRKLLLISVFCFYLWSCVLGNPVAEPLQSITVKNCGRTMYDADTRDRIVGGTFASRGEYPFLVSLNEDDEHACGATIINERWVLTAAHCILYANQPNRYDVRAGLYKLSESNGRTVQINVVEKIIIHEDYQEKRNYNDVTLLKLVKPLDIAGSKGFVNGVCLPETNADPTGRAVVCGWGHEWYQGENSDTLKHVTVPMVDRQTCSRIYTRARYPPVIDNQICAGEKGSDSCQNDSGGPLFQTDDDGRTVLIGVVSSGGDGCGDGRYPGIYSKVYSFLPWIRHTIARN